MVTTIIRTEEGESVPSECAIKVFKTTLNKFMRRDDYIKDDYRFKHTYKFSKQNPRKIVKLWAEKEKFNLKRYLNLLKFNIYIILLFCTDFIARGYYVLRWCT